LEFIINVGNIPPNEVEQFMQKTINQMKKTPYVDPQTGQYNLRFNMQNMMEDFYIPVRGGDTSTKIDTTPGLTYDGIQDVEYLRDKMFAALKVPKAYFGYEGDLQGKATLAAEDIRFARTIERIQRIIESELTKIALVHLYTQGFKGESLTNFEIKLSSPSIIYEQEKEEDPLGGRDPLGTHGMKGGYPSDNENVSESGVNNLNTKALFSKLKGELPEPKKELIFKKLRKNTGDLLNEANLRDLED